MLTDKQSAFVDEYLIDLNATQAAIRAGYSAKTAHSAGPRLLENVEVQRAVSAAQAARSERTKTTADWVLENIRHVAETCMKPGNPGHHALTDAAQANKSLELLGKHLGLFKEVVEQRQSYVARIPEVIPTEEDWLKTVKRAPAVPS